MVNKLFFYFNIYLLFNNLYAYNFNKIRGTSLGSLFVLEPFITPSLFYPFLGNSDKVISDTYSFCDYLGPIEANKRLKNHWEKWVDENTIKRLYETKLNTIRIPIGDYMFIPYGPYAKIENNISCFSGSLEYLDKIISYTNKYGLNTILDIHAYKDSQNGFDNSGQTKNMEIYKLNNTLYFKHWEIRTSNWIGDFDTHEKYYKRINNENIQYSLNVIDLILNKYKDYEGIWGLSPINEPWEYTPIDELKNFYKKVYDKVINKWTKEKVLILHDSFRGDLWQSCDFLDNPLEIDVYLDTHQYIAWNGPIPFDLLLTNINNWKYPKTCFKVIVGEFSLATDNCMMWLNGFMDNLPNYPFQKCYNEVCPKYEGLNIEYIKKSSNGPFGTGISYPSINGMCPISTPIYLNSIISNKRDNEATYASKLFSKFTTVFEQKTYGWLFWNFQTESSFYSWNYLSSYEAGYITIQDDLLKLENINDVNNNTNIKIIISLFFLIALIYLFYTFYYSKLKIINQYKYISIDSTPIKSNIINKNYKSIYVQENIII